MKQSQLSYLGLKGPLLAIGDIHAPFHSKPWAKWIIALAKELQPAYIVQMGDSRDYYCFSKWAKSLSIMTPRQELNDGRRYVEDLWADVKAAAPKAECWQLLGNHDVRPNKRIAEQAAALDVLIDWDKQFTFDGVKTIIDPAEELIIGNVFLHHGHKQHGAHARWNQAPTVVGHLHTGGVVMFQNRFGPYFELNAGYGGDETSPVFAYRYQKKIHGWTRGAGVIDELGPRFAVHK